MSPSTASSSNSKAESVSIDPGYLLPETKIGYYEIIGRLGAGGFGAVYKVKRDGRIFALKIAAFKAEDLSREAREQHERRLDREIVALKSLHHPNIVRAFDNGRWPTFDGYPYLVLDYVDGQRLYDWIETARPTFMALCEVFIKIALALHEMHRLEIIHRDLKSDNVLVRADGEPILLDLGISRPKSAYTLTRADIILGTVSHLPPEFCAWLGSPESHHGQKPPSAPTYDLYTLGVMFYESLTGGHSPYPRDPTEPEDPDDSGNTEINQQIATMRRIQSQAPRPPLGINPQIPPELEAVVLRLLAKAPRDRPQTGGELAEELRRIVASAPADAFAAVLPSRKAHPPVSRSLSIELEPSVEVLPSTAAPSNATASMRPAAARSSATSQPPERQPAPPPASVFNAPSLNTTFHPPDTGGAAPASPEPSSAPQLPTNLRPLGELLRTPKPATSKTKFKLIAAGAAVVVFLLLLSLLADRRKPQPESLISKVEKEAKEAKDTTQKSIEEQQEHPLELIDAVGTGSKAQRPSGLAAPSLPAAGTPAAASPRPTAAGAEKDIDRLLAQTYGRPMVAPDGTVSMPARAAPTPAPGPAPVKESPFWLQHGTRVDAPRVAAAKHSPAHGNSKYYGVGTGSHIRARLITNLDSRTVSSGPIEARLTRPFIVDDTSIFPSRTYLYGSASTSGDRFTLRITRARLPDNSEIEFSGLAYDLVERKPGLSPSRRIAGDAPKRDSLGKEIAKGAANTLLNTVTGGLAQDVARGSGQAVVNHAGEDATSSSAREAILLDAGADFDVFVESPF